MDCQNPVLVTRLSAVIVKKQEEKRVMKPGENMESRAPAGGM